METVKSRSEINYSAPRLIITVQNWLWNLEMSLKSRRNCNLCWSCVSIIWEVDKENGKGNIPLLNKINYLLRIFYHNGPFGSHCAYCLHNALSSCGSYSWTVLTSRVKAQFLNINLLQYFCSLSVLSLHILYSNFNIQPSLHYKWFNLPLNLSKSAEKRIIPCILLWITLEVIFGGFNLIVFFHE